MTTNSGVEDNLTLAVLDALDADLRTGNLNLVDKCNQENPFHNWILPALLSAARAHLAEAIKSRPAKPSKLSKLPKT
jgi:hypothetical protein